MLLERTCDAVVAVTACRGTLYGVCVWVESWRSSPTGSTECAGLTLSTLPTAAVRAL